MALLDVFSLAEWLQERRESTEDAEEVNDEYHVYKPYSKMRIDQMQVDDKALAHILRPISVAPMMDRTDRHYRYMLRLISKQTLLYTEMVTTGAILFGDKGRHLDFSPWKIL